METMDYTKITTPVLFTENDPLVLKCGGFAVIRIREDHKELVRSCFGETLKGAYLEDFLTKKNPEVIMVDTNVANQLSQDQIDALLWHEEAHVRLGHLPYPEENQPLDIHDNVDHELQADAFAANKVGLEVYLGALDKVLEIKRKDMGQGGLFKRVLVTMALAFDKNIMARKAALQKAMR